MELEILRQYQLTAHRTAIYPRRKDLAVMGDTGGVIYTTLGLCGECAEYHLAFTEYHKQPHLNKKAVVKEAGDVCWYLVEFLAELDIPVDVLINSEAYQSGRPFKNCMYYAGCCSELIKKGIRDFGKINPESLTKIIANLQLLWASLNFDMGLLGLNMEDILEENNKKLLSRLERGKLQGSGDNR
ncbi:MAG: hypothetical protein RBR16_09375 [Syntrophus sp. (in: bacteria)]|nr:hypothetical protein [Syntrophus sp. (in: bacteria)]